MQHWAISVVPIALAIGASATHGSPLRPSAGFVIPTVYEAGHFIAVPQLPDGRRLRLLVDTGGGGTGGMYWIGAAAADRAGVEPVECRIGDEAAMVARLPDYKKDQGLPTFGDGPCGRSLMVFPGAAPTYDGQLGGAYLSRGIWTFDYPAQRLTSEGLGWKANPASHGIPLGFQRDDDGKLTSGFPRLQIKVDGQVLDMLLDTGASSYPTPAAATISGTPTVHGQGVASYITTDTLERWHKSHSDWRIVEDADDKVAAKPLKRIIEVPRVEVAGWAVGPVWFTEQPAMAFHEYMAQWMDKPVEGAVGGNVLAPFVLTVDYPRSKAYFRCMRGCTAAAGEGR